MRLNKKDAAKLDEIYYQPTHLWVGNEATEKLVELSGLSMKKVQIYLAHQAIWQVHIPGPKVVKHPHFAVTIPNQVHQFDLLSMPGDKLYGSKYKYILSGVDIASRFKVARPLRTKKVKDVAALIEDIYKAGEEHGLAWPKTVMLDAGTEFLGEVTKLFQKHNVKIDRTVTKYHHRHTAFVENFNKQLAKRLFKAQDAQELNEEDKVSTTWVKQLYEIVDQMNKTKTSGIKMKPINAIKLKEVLQMGNYKPDKVTLKEDGLYRYLVQPGEEHGDQRRRATDMIWSKKTYRLNRIVNEANNRTMYYLEDGPERAFVKEELLQVPEDTQAPPDYVQKW